MPLESISFVVDDSPFSPREDDNVGVIACRKMARYSLGDEQFAGSVEEFKKTLPKGSIVIPLFFRDHGGAVTLRTKPWSQSDDPVGVVYASPQQVITNYGDNTPSSRKAARRVMTGELETYTQYLNGDCYGMKTVDEDGEEEVVYGFFGTNVFDNGMAGNLCDEDLPLLMEAVSDSAYMMGTKEQFDDDIAQRLTRQMAKTRAATRPRSR